MGNDTIAAAAAATTRYRVHVGYYWRLIVGLDRPVSAARILYFLDLPYYICTIVHLVLLVTVPIVEPVV